ncbi:MAG: hypothetical protein WA853_06125 [Candidatus Acidiferrum sp.]
MSALHLHRLLAARLTLAFLFLSIACTPLLGQEQPGVTEISPTLFVFSTASGNVVASIGPDGALLLGTPSAASTAFINNFTSQHTKSPARYVVIYPSSAAKSQGDAGWGKLGAFVTMHENALRRLGGDAMGPPGGMPSFAEPAIDRPRIAFSEVIAFDLNGDAIHIVHQKPGYSDADALTHFHRGNAFYLGEVFPGDGYPLIDAAQGGTLSGLLSQLNWTDPKQHVVPARGKVVSGTELKAFSDMITTVRDRIQRLVNGGSTEAQVIAAHPTSDLDEEWGHGRVSSETFVQEIYDAVKKGTE